jgi:hypothetical protein
MRRTLAAFACAVTLGFATAAPSVAKDVLLTVLIDGRPMDSKGPSGLLHRSTAFVNVVRATKAFDGLLIFSKNDRSVTVSIRSQTTRFVVGNRNAVVAGQPVVFRVAPFDLYGEIYVPLAAIAKIANVGMVVDAKRGVAKLSTPL